MLAHEAGIIEGWLGQPEGARRTGMSRLDGAAPSYRRPARRDVVLPPDRSWLAATAAGNARAGRLAQRPRGSGPATWGAVNRQTITSFSWIGSDARSSLTMGIRNGKRASAGEPGGPSPRWQVMRFQSRCQHIGTEQLSSRAEQGLAPYSGVVPSSR